MIVMALFGLLIISISLAYAHFWRRLDLWKIEDQILDYLKKESSK